MLYPPVNCPEAAHCACRVNIVYQLTRILADKRNHLLQALWIYEVYVVQILHHLGCVFVFSAASEDKYPRHENIFNSPYISLILCV